MRINHNISALKANNQLGKTNNALDKSLERLSSGYRINSAADDSAGLAISEKMRTQIAGLDQASRNASDGISVIQTAEGALSEVESMLQRMRELSVESANGTYTANDRAAIQSEINELNGEVKRISDTTEFNTMKLLNGNIDTKSYSNSSNVSLVSLSDTVKVGNYGVNILQDARQAVVVGNTTTFAGLPSSTKITSAQAGIVNINGESVEIKEGDTINEAFEKIRDACDTVNVNVFAVKNGSVPSLTDNLDMAGYTSKELQSGDQLVYVSNEYGSDEKIKIYCDNADLCGLLGLTTKGIIAQGYDAKADLVVNTNDSSFKNTATVSVKGNKVTVSDSNNFNMIFEVKPGTKASVYTDTQVTSSSASAISSIPPEPSDYPAKTASIGGESVLVTSDARQAVIKGNTTPAGTASNTIAPAIGTITVNSSGLNADGVTTYSFTRTVSVSATDTMDDIIDKISTECSKVEPTDPITTDTEDNTGKYIGFSIIAADAAASSSVTSNAGYTSESSYQEGDRLLFYSQEAGKNDNISISCSDPNLSAFLGLSTSVVAAQGYDAKVSLSDSSSTEYNLSVDGNAVTLTDKSDATNKLTGTVTSNGTEFNDTTITSVTTSSASSKKDYSGIDITVTVLDAGPMDLQIGANEDQTMSVRIPKVNPETLGIDKINVATAEGAQKAIGLIDAAINTVSAIRSKLGAYENRLDHSISNLDTTSENMTESLSRISDVDMAEEMAEYTQKNVLSQAGTSMLAQANQRPQSILSLLQQ